jgi:small subunit ribosomal protein S6
MSTVKLRKYETVVVTKTDAGHEAQRKLYEKVTDLMAKNGARHTRFELWGKRRLAYPIAKSTKGIYLYYVYLASGDFVKDLHRTLKLSNIVLRYLSVQLASDIDPETYDFEKEKQFDALPTESDEGFDHGRPTTGWDSEFQGREGAKRVTDDDDDEDEDEERPAKDGEKPSDDDEEEE